ncbi:MAG: hypothetical protein B7Z08_12100 [Sphingomonadales bacterium 32-68-7]|nr:MAG: hypothetical protein B7Z33_04140 [Sphingomonadales bacterium 12-68-11]OYX07595.1 MAG: hypothetical protein B7Z08_12100 [Sphingomonadales bacterium 32-68-7]
MRAARIAMFVLAAVGALAVTGLVLNVPADSAPLAEAPASAAQARGGRVFLTADQTRRGAETGLLPAGVRSILDLKGKLKHGEYRWDDTGVPAGELAIRVDIDRQLVSVFRSGHEIGTAVVLYGAEGKPTPLGRFPIKSKHADYHSRTYDAPMPFAMFLTDDGVAVHGSNVRWGRASNGCVGVPEEFARLLFDAARVGDVVEVVASGRG